MKKLMVCILALVLSLSTFTLVACSNGGSNGGGGGSVYATVSAAIENTLKAKSYDANVVNQLKRNLMGNLSENSVNVNIKAAALDTTKPQISVDGTRTMDGYTGESMMYFDGEWKYFEYTADGGYKMACSLADFTKEAGAPQGFILPLPESLFGNAQSKKNDDGSLTVTLTLDEASVETLYKDVVAAVVYDVVGTDLNQTVTKDASIVVTVVDGYVREYQLAFVSEITAGSDKVTFTYSNAIAFVSCDQAVTVNVPANLDQFYIVDGY